MRFTKLSLFIAGAVGILMLGVPRAAHAVAAALVQVTNTASSPVISQSIGNQAAQIVEIACGDQPTRNITTGCYTIAPDGFAAGAAYVVPDNETLVVTSLDISSGIAAGSPCMSPAFANLMTTAGFINQIAPRMVWIVPAGAGTVHYVYPSGILFSPGTNITSITNTTTSCTLMIDMHGYLTAQ
jgi:hypothetical protein